MRCEGGREVVWSGDTQVLIERALLLERFLLTDCFHGDSRHGDRRHPDRCHGDHRFGHCGTLSLPPY